tara:strand:+ start:2168 stop:2887 length:720 start_codon:yes stop_codon:yes gene_type:complete
MNKKLAIVNCKSRKKDYTCPADEMYSHSFQFRHQIEFIKEYYDDYLILSTKYGLITPDTIISPYSLSLARGNRLKNKDIFTKEEIQKWGEKVLDDFEPYFEYYNQIDLHISNAYLNPIKSILNNPHINHIKQPNNPGDVKVRYSEVLESFKNGEVVDLNVIGELRPTKYEKVNFYHKNHPTFFGNVDELVEKYPEVDPGNLGRVRRGGTSFLHTCGWVVDEDVLSKLYQTKSGKFRLKK